MSSSTIEIRTANTQKEYALARKLFIDYQQFLRVDLCFQSFEEELNDLPSMYGPPSGILLLAYKNNSAVGCVALRKKQHNICEMKRLYVPAEYRGFGIGNLLASAIMSSAASMGYEKMILDTLERLTPAIQLYTKLGFTYCDPYYANPLEGVRFLQRSL